jgi:hypothetical protein
MNRRNLLAALSSSTAAGLAGCTGVLSNDSDSASSSSTTQRNTPEPDPTVSSWSEEWLRGSNYRVNVTVQLDGTEQILIKKGSMRGETADTITSSGEHTVAGPNTEVGTVEPLQSIWLVRPRQSDRIDQPVDSFIVGSQQQLTYPLHLGGLRGNTFPDAENTTTLSRTYTHEINGETRLLSLEIPDGLYQYYANRDRTRNYGAYVSESNDDQYIQSIVDEFEAFGEQRGLSDFGIINEMMKFVQNLEYTTDQVSDGYNEYPKYPVETLVDQGGDCEDTCILLASMLEQFGYGTVLLIFEDQQHMALGLAGEAGIEGTYYEQGGRRYYYTETTSPGWRVGQLPSNMEVGNPTLAPINDSAVLVFSYVVNTSTEGGASVEIYMRNAGDGTGEAQAEIAFENRNGETVVSERTDSRQLSPDEEYTTTVHMLPPSEQTLRANVSVLLDGRVHNTLQSEYQEPIGPPMDS